MKLFKNFFNNKCQLKLIIINFIISFLVVLILPVRFQTNDDIVMSWIASGFYTGIADCHLIFIHHYYGLFLNFLYNTFEGFEWYSICFIILHSLCLSIIEKIIIKDLSVSKTIKFVLLAVLISYAYTILVLLQFTTLAAFIAFSVLLKFYYVDTKFRHYLISFMLFVIASFIRFEAVILVSAIFFLFYFFLSNRTKKLFFKFLIFVAFILSIVSLHIIDKAYYTNDTQWSEYYNYNKLRGFVYGNSLVSFSELASEEDISENDIDLFSMSFADPNIVGEQKLQNISNGIITSVSFNTIMSHIYKTLSHISGLNAVLLLMILSTLLMSIVTQSKKRLQYILIAFCIISLLVLIIVYASLKVRLLYVILFSINLLFLINYKQSIKYTLINYFAYVLLFCALIVVPIIKYAPKMNSLSLQNQLISKVDDKSVLFLMGSAANLQWLPAFELSSFYQHRISVKGWLTKIPFNENISSYKTLIESDFYCLFPSSMDSSKFTNELTKSLLDNYNIEMQFREEEKNIKYVLIHYFK